MAYELEQADLEALLQGGCFFGSGGGGTVTSARHLAAHFVAGDYYPRASVRVVDAEEATEGEAVMVAYLGAPVAINDAQYPIGPVQAVQQIVDKLAAEGRRLAYIAPPESGALGFVVACLVAARLGLAVIDGDGAGRAVPSLPMLTYAAAGVSPRPALLVSQGGLSVELDVKPADPASEGKDAHQQDVSAIVERMMRPIVGDPEFHQFGGLAMWVMTPEVLRGAMPIRGTLTRALELGRALQAGGLRDTGALLGWLRERYDLKAQALFGPAAIASAGVDTTGGFDLGKVSLQAAAGGATATVLYQNESLLAWSSAAAAPLGMAPDSLAYFAEGEGQQVFSNGDLLGSDGQLDPSLKGRSFSLIGIPAAAPLRVPGGLILESFMAQVAQLGYLGPYQPLSGQSAAVAGGAQ